MFRFIVLSFAMLAFGATGNTTAQPAPPVVGTDPLNRRADDVLAVIRGQGDLPTVFSNSFLAQVPPAQIAAIGEQLAAMNGPVQRIERIEKQGALTGILHVGFERAVVRMQLALEPAPPNRIIGLQVLGVEPRGEDSASAVIAEFRGLPGKANLQVTRLGAGSPASLAAHQPEEALAIGSAFKLIILAELSRQVQAGERRWTDVVPVSRHSLPSGILQDWPLGSPATLHTLAALMISRSDNTATDVLLHVAGREKVERMMQRMGMSNAARNRPFLTTMELFQLKADSPAARAQWVQADEAGRRRLLREREGRSGPALNFATMFRDGPVAIDSVEWFATADDMVRVMDWLRLNADDTAKAVMAINSGLGPDVARGFSYLGFKGGSEPGVINLTFLVRTNAGTWHVVTGSWNNPAAAVDELRFVGLMTRAVRLVR